MSRKYFNEEQLQLLRKNPYVYSVTPARLQLTKQFKELFLTAYRSGESPREILDNYGFDLGILGERRIWSIAYHIRDEFNKYGEFREGYRPRDPKTALYASDQFPTEKDEIKRLQHEVDYLKQEMEFLKKISSIRFTGK